MKMRVIDFNERIVWETAKIMIEENGNPVTVKLLDRDYKYIYTYIKKNAPVESVKVFQRFPKLPVESILYDLREMYLIYFVREEVE